MPCIPPEHPSNFHLGGPNRKNRVEEKRIEKSWIFQIIVRLSVNFAFAQQGSNQPCGLLLSARETPTTGIASSSKSKGFGLLFFIPSHPARLHTFVSTGKLLTMCLRVL